MKYICINPEDIVEEVNTKGIYGKGRIMSRIKLKKWEAEYGLFCEIINPSIDYFDYKISEADISEAFNYLYVARRCNVTRDAIWRELRGLFDIKEINQDENGNCIIKVEYLPIIKSLKEDLTQDRLWNELEEIHQSLSFLEYTEEEASIIIKTIIEKYTNDLQTRNDIVFEEEPFIGKNLYIGGNHNFQVKDITYIIEGEEYTVRTILLGASDAEIEPPACRFPSNDGYMEIEIIRKAQNGEKETIAEISRSGYISYITHDHKIDKKSRINNISYNIIEENGEKRITLDYNYRLPYTDFDNPDVKNHLNLLVDEETIDLIQQILWNKVKFEIVETKDTKYKTYKYKL